MATRRTAAADESRVNEGPLAIAVAPGADPAVPAPPAVTPYVQGIFTAWVKRGAHPKYREFEGLMRGVSGVANAPETAAGAPLPVTTWDFIEHAVGGKGGFVTGDYLDPFELEIENRQLRSRLRKRMQQSTYYNFVKPICHAPWDVLMTTKDYIKRVSDDSAIEDFWRNADGLGRQISDVLRYPALQACKFPVGFIIVDRPPLMPGNSAGVPTAADNVNPDFAPYIYGVATKNVVDWRLSRRGVVLALVVLEPDEDGEPSDTPPVRVWTRDQIVLFRPRDVRKPRAADNYEAAEIRSNDIGEVPVVRIYVEEPEPGEMYGDCDMFIVACAGKEVYNIKSEKRDIERKCGAVFVISDDDDVQTGSETKDVNVGPDNVLRVSSKAAFPPQWVMPNLDVVAKLQEEQAACVEAAYDEAGLAAMFGTKSYNSGYEMDLDLSKSNRRLGSFAGSMEKGENDIIRLVAKYMRGPRFKLDNGTNTVLYPREFGIRDEDKLIDRVSKLLDLNLGDECDKKFIDRLLTGLFAREPRETIDKLIDDAVAQRGKNRAVADRLKEMVGKYGDKLNAGGAPGTPPMPPKPPGGGAQ